MKTKLIIGVLLLSAALLIIPVAADETAPVLPLQVYGTVSYADGENLPVGTVLTATVDGVTSTFTVTEAGKIGGPGTFDEKFLINGTTNGSTVTFKVNGVPADVTGGCTFASGEGKQIILTEKKVEAEVDTDAETKDLIKEKPVVVSASGEIPDDFKLTIRIIPETTPIPPKPEKTEMFKAIEITASCPGISVLIPITITDAELKNNFGNDRSNVGAYHYNGTLWEKVPIKDLEIKTGETIFWVLATSFSPYIIVSEAVGPTPTPTQTPTPVPKPSQSGSGESPIWLTATPTTTQTPTPGDVPSVKPTDNPTQPGKSPMPFLGIFAGLGAAVVLFAARQRR